MEELTLILDTTYDVRFEALESYKTSLFRDVYRKASVMMEEIVSNNEKLVQERYNDERLDEQMCNVIAFLGGRGSGKSSALLSYCNFLKRFREYYSDGAAKPENLDEEVKALIEKGQKSRIKFNVLKMIDATMLEQGETIVGIVLARMLEMVEKRERELGGNGRNQDDMAELGRSIKTDIGRIYQFMHCKPKNDYEEDAPVLMVKALSNSWNLRTVFKNLVGKFNRYLICDNYGYGIRYDGESYLVIPIDDIDMNVDKCREMLEMIRKYLMVPKVILLLNFNYEQLDIVCRNYYKEILFPTEGDKESFRETYRETSKDSFKEGLREICPGNYSERRDKIMELTREYLEKVVPTGRKIYMPQLYYLDGSMQKKVVMGGFKTEGVRKEINLPGFGPHPVLLRPEVYICALLRFYTGVVCLPDERNEYIYPQSIRRLNNYVKEFLKLKCLESGKTDPGQKKTALEQYNRNVSWLYQDVTSRFLKQYVESTEKEIIEEYLRDTQDEKNCILLKMLLERAGEGHGQWQEMIRQIDRERIDRGYICYGDYLLMLYIARNNHFVSDNALICWHLLISLKCTQLYFKDRFEYEKSTYLRDNLWGNWDDWRWFKEMNDRKAVPMFLEGEREQVIELARVTDIMDGGQPAKRKEVEEAVKAYFLIRMFLNPLHNAEGNTQTEIVVQDDFILGLELFRQWKFQAGNFLACVWNYEEVIDTFAEEINKTAQDSIKGQVLEIRDSFRQEMKEWSDKYGTVELIPFFSSQFMERVQRRFYGREKMLISRIEYHIRRLLDIMEEELEQIGELNRIDKMDITISWNDILEEDKKQSDYFTISSCVDAFRDCPVVKLLREEKETEGIAKKAYEALAAVLNAMANRVEALEDSETAEDILG